VPSIILLPRSCRRRNAAVFNRHARRQLSSHQFPWPSGRGTGAAFQNSAPHRGQAFSENRRDRVFALVSLAYGWGSNGQARIFQGGHSGARRANSLDARGCGEQTISSSLPRSSCRGGKVGFSIPRTTHQDNGAVSVEMNERPLPNRPWMSIKRRSARRRRPHGASFRVVPGFGAEKVCPTTRWGEQTLCRDSTFDPHPAGFARFI